MGSVNERELKGTGQNDREVEEHKGEYEDISKVPEKMKFKDVYFCTKCFKILA